jgi:hypothetical protein
MSYGLIFATCFVTIFVSAVESRCKPVSDGVAYLREISDCSPSYETLTRESGSLAMGRQQLVQRAETDLRI